MKRKTLSISVPAILLTSLFFSAFSMPDAEVMQKMAGQWKSVEDYTEDGAQYSYVEVIWFTTAGKYRGYSEKYKNGVSVEHEKFRGFFTVKDNSITWESEGEEPWTDRVTVSLHSLTFTDDEGEEMKYIKISRK